MTVYCLQIVGVVLQQASESNDSVEAGRDALSQWGRYPWYNSDTDSLEPVKIVEPWNWDWLWKWFNFSGLGNVSFDWFQWLFWCLIILVLCLLVWLLYRAFLKSTGSSESLLEKQGESPEEQRRRMEALPEPVRRRTHLLEEARRCYQAGDYNEAVIYLFSHQLVCLDKNFLIRLARGKTNRQYLRELGPRDRLKRMQADTTVAFEDVFFGGRSIGRERFEYCWNRLGEFEALAAGGAIR